MNWKIIAATAIGIVCGGAAAFLGYKYYDDHKEPEHVRTQNKIGWKPPEDDPETNFAEMEHPADSDEYDGEETPEMKSKMTQAAKKPPYCIDESEFFYGEKDYDKNRGLAWYQEDNVLVDDNDEIFPHPERIIGEENISNMRYRLDGDMYYVRNDVAGADYEIEIHADAFSDNKDLGKE